MRVFVSSSRDEIGKLEGIVRAFPNIWEGAILDVGCRSGHLRRVLPNAKVRYYGLDLFPPANVIGDLEAGLPFENVSSDTVLALDVLEHTNHIHKAFGELCRVASKYVLVTLPNAYELSCRIKFLFGQQFSGKYGLPLDPPNDRHRWLFSLHEARLFIYAMARRHRFEVVVEGCFVGRRRGAPGARLMVSVFPSLLSPSYVALLHRKTQSGYEN